jgi:hypothetical protein
MLYFDNYRDDRYQSNSGSVLHNTINKLHQQQSQNQPSTSRLSNVVTNQQPAYAGRMRPQISTQIGQQQQILASDLSESVLLPTSSTSPQNNVSMYAPQQTAIKSEPNYEMANNEYFDSTSDAESHYSQGGRSLTQGGSEKPRKYRIKPESERLNPQYRMKRAKNNSAVRRSREKAKHQQLEKERRLQFLENEHNDHYKIVNSYKQRIRELENENLSLRKNCSCGAAQNIFHR